MTPWSRVPRLEGARRQVGRLRDSTPASNCLDRPSSRGPGRNKAAFILGGEPGDRRDADLLGSLSPVNAFANVLKSLE